MDEKRQEAWRLLEEMDEDLIREWIGWVEIGAVPDPVGSFAAFPEGVKTPAGIAAV